MASVTYYTAAGQTSFTAPEPTGLPIWEQPFPEQSARLVFRQRYTQRADSWAPTALNTAFDYPGSTSLYVPSIASASFYLIEESGFSDRTAGVAEWDRVYAVVPANRYDYMTYPYEFPAVVRSLSLGAYSSVTYVADVGGGRMFVDFTAADPSNQLSLSYKSTGGVGQLGVVPVFDYASGGLIVAMNSSFLSTTYPRAAAKVNYSLGRQFPLAAPGRAVVSFGYFLASPGPTFNVTPTPRFKVTLNGEEVKVVSNTTVPTSVSYLAMITSPSYFVAEDEQISRWRGNIYERKVIYVYAQ